MARDEKVIIFGEDVGGYGGVFRVTKDLLGKYGPSRVRDTPISEQAITALAIGFPMMGMKPVAEIMFADFLALSLDALVNQASMIPFIWAGQVTLPFVLRTQGESGAGAADQHSKSLEAMIAHIPGLKVLIPVTPADAKGLLTAAIRDPNPVIFFEHKLLYNTKGPVPDGEHLTPIGKAAGDRIVPPIQAECLGEGVAVHVLEGAGHMPQMERPDEVNDLIRSLAQASEDDG
jgi:pyruvate dehydrogenase E1 component beta subunit